jgi:hypothetical protein
MLGLNGFTEFSLGAGEEDGGWRMEDGILQLVQEGIISEKAW